MGEKICKVDFFFLLLSRYSDSERLKYYITKLKLQVMKKFKYLLIAIVALVVCSCGASVEELSEEVRKEIKAEYSKDYYNVVVGDFTLVHKGGNDYESVVDITLDGVTTRFALKVLYDGDAFTWKTTPVY